MASYTINRNAFLGSALEGRATISIGNKGQATFKSDLQEIWEGVQADRADMLTQVRTLQLAVQLLMQGESLRIAALAPDDDRVALLAQVASRAADRVAMLDEEIAVAEVRVPMVKKTEALLHGRITDEADRAAGPVTVTLADENGRAVAGVPPVEVDSGGYYAIVVPAEVAAGIGADRKLGLVVSHGDAQVAAPVAPLTLGSGAIALLDVKLSSDTLDKLKVRLSVGLGAASGPAGTKGRASRPSARAAGSRAGKAGGRAKRPRG